MTKQERQSPFEIIKLDQSLIEYLRVKRGSPKGKKPSQKAVDMTNSINMLMKGEAIKIPVNSEREARNLRVWVAQNKKHLKPDVRNVHVVYKREENLLYIFRDNQENIKP